MGTERSADQAARKPSSVGLSHRRLSDTVHPTKPFWFWCPLCFPNVLVGCPHQVYTP